MRRASLPQAGTTQNANPFVRIAKCILSCEWQSVLVQDNFLPHSQRQYCKLADTLRNRPEEPSMHLDGTKHKRLISFVCRHWCCCCYGTIEFEFLILTQKNRDPFPNRCNIRPTAIEQKKKESPSTAEKRDAVHYHQRTKVDDSHKNPAARVPRDRYTATTFVVLLVLLLFLNPPADG